MTVFEGGESRFPALQSRAFRLLWFGLALSAVGTKMQDTAIRWQMYDLTHSMFALGMIGLCRFVPMAICSLLGGLVADSIDRRKTIIFAQVALAAGAALISALTYEGMISTWGIYGVSALTGAASAFDSPARHSVIPNLVPRRHYLNAVSLNSTTYKLATVIGPLLAGGLLQRGNIALIYGINAASFAAVAVAAICLPREAATPQLPSGAGDRGRLSFSSLVEGIKFVKGQPILVWPMCLDFFASLLGSSEALLPVFAREILKVDALGYGLLTAASAIGSVGAAAVIALKRPVVRQGLALLIAVAVYGAALVVFGLSAVFAVSVVALVVAGAADTVSSIVRNTLRQAATPDHLRGRMTALNMIFFTGGPQLGNLEAGVVASWVGAPLSVVSGGIGCILAALWVGFRAPVLYNHSAE